VSKLYSLYIGQICLNQYFSFGWTGDCNELV